MGDDRTDQPTRAADPGMPTQRRRSLSPAGLLWLSAGLPVAISVVSLLLSIYAVIEANREPEIWLSAPDIVRIAAGQNAWFYIQPRLVSAARNDRVAIVTSLQLEVRPAGGEPVTFIWDEQGTWQYDPAAQGLTWIYVADPAPLVVGPASPQLPICLFEGPLGWRWQPGTYFVTIVAARGQGAPLRTEFIVTLPAESIAAIGAQSGTWIGVRTAPVDTDPNRATEGTRVFS
jgi:hypothetical protein